MTTAKELIEMLEKCNPDTQIELHADSYHTADIQLHISHRRDCDGEYIVAELQQFETEF